MFPEWTNNKVEMNGFSISIESTTSHIRLNKINGDNYFAMKHGTEYKINLGNNNHTKADAHIWIDGEQVGIWRLNSYDNITIERPANVSRKFTLLKENSRDARNAGVSYSQNNGLLKVTFMPEKDRYDDDTKWFCSNKMYDMPERSAASKSFNQLYSANSLNNESLSTGATVLGDTSHQQFGRANKLHDIDESLKTTIYARLVVDNNESDRYVSLSKVLQNQKPPRIEDIIEDRFDNRFNNVYGGIKW